MRYSSRPSGFTLLELTIVLVIIGLIAGGVLVGRELIEAAKLRQQIGQIDQFTAAFNTFKVKYGCLPGDCADAVSKGLGTSTANHNGDGNQRFPLIRPQINSSQKDSINIFFHLSQANLIEQQITGYGGESGFLVTSLMQAFFPTGKLQGSYIVATNLPAFHASGPPSSTATRDGGNGFAIVSEAPSWRFYQAVPFNDIATIDRKIDDGIPISGSVGVAPMNTNGAWGDLSPAVAPAGHSCIATTYNGSTCDNSLSDNFWAVPLFLFRF